MKRFNYLGTGARRPFAHGFTAIEIDNRLRGPLAALLATIVVAVPFGGSALMRLHRAQSAYHAAAERLAADQPKLLELDALRAREQAEERLDDRIAAIRRANVRHTDELVLIGNHLPAGVWLQHLRYEGNGYVLEGTSEHAANVGTALIALATTAPGATPQLMWLRVDPNAAGERFRYALRLRTGS